MGGGSEPTGEKKRKSLTTRKGEISGLSKACARPKRHSRSCDERDRSEKPRREKGNGGQKLSPKRTSLYGTG